MGAAAEKKADSRPSHLWTSSAEPHAQRRKLMLQKYGAQVGRGATPAQCACAPCWAARCNSGTV